MKPFQAGLHQVQNLLIQKPEPILLRKSLIGLQKKCPSLVKGEKIPDGYLAKHPYPQMAKENRIEGRVTAEFIIDKTRKRS